MRPILAALVLGCAASLAALLTASVAGQSYPHPLRGSVARITVHGASLEGNLSGDSADRPVTVYLPPGYAVESGRRYPVLYALHGYTDDDQYWMGWQQYRTIPERAGRGLTGHSMGGYGAKRIGMKHPGVFASVYAMSPSCLAPRVTASPEAAATLQRLEGVTTMEAFGALDFGTRALVASLAAWAPNPQNPPFFIDLPTKDGQLQPMVMAKLAANAPLAVIDQYIPNIRRLAAFGIDSGDQDRGIAPTVTEVHRILEQYQVAHDYGIYPGNHVNNVHARIRSTVIPFFARSLAFEVTR